jgi:hypothetical protein
MAEIDFLDALDACIDRMNSGEPLERCLRDYPQHTDRLRDLLQTGALVARAQQYPDADERDAGQRTRASMERALQSKRALQRRRGLIGAVVGAAATLVIVMGLYGIFTTLSAQSQMGLTATVIVSTNQSVALELTDTSVAVETGVAASGNPALTLTAVPTLPGATMLGGATMPPITLAPVTSLAAGLSATPAPFGTSLPTPSPQSSAGTATSAARVSPVPSSTPAALGQQPTQTPSPTGTATVTNTPPGTATVTPTPSPAGTMLPITGTATTPPLPIPTGTLADNLQPTAVQPVQVIPLNAGEIDDNARWDNYLLYRRNYLAQYQGTVHDVDVSNRQIITVMDEQGMPLIGTWVRVYNGQTLVSESRTYANGETLFFPNANPAGRGAQSYNVVIQKDEQAGAFILDPARGPEWRVSLAGTRHLQEPVKLDVLFLLDATGSMGDEIAQLQNNILGISGQIAQLNADARYGLVTYRDRGDEYIVRTDNFTGDVNAFQATLMQVQANGGGDEPESLNEALHAAVQSVSWRGDETIKLIFLVADAPPHLDYPNDFDYAQEMAAAAARGIKIHPIASSGLTPSGEFIFRQLAQYTLGRFLFLTYQSGSSGAPGESRGDLQVGAPAHPEQGQQGDYTVEHLDELVLKLVREEIAARGQRPANANVTLTPIGPAPSPTTPANTLPPTLTPTPTPFPTHTPPPDSGSPTPTTIAAAQRATGGKERSSSGFTPIQAVGLVVMGAGVGYLLNTRRPMPKRKNGETIDY